MLRRSLVGILGGCVRTAGSRDHRVALRGALPRCAGACGLCGAPPAHASTSARRARRGVAVSLAFPGSHGSFLDYIFFSTKKVTALIFKTNTSPRPRCRATLSKYYGEAHAHRRVSLSRHSTQHARHARRTRHAPQPPHAAPHVYTAPTPHRQRSRHTTRTHTKTRTHARMCAPGSFWDCESTV